jgi:O-antigen/teichoic acid export membrane protein
MVTQLISLLTAPIMARLYSPEDYGLLGLFIAFTGLVQVPSTMLYPSAIVLPKRDEDSLALIKGTLLLCFAFVATIGCVLCFCGSHVLLGSKYESIMPWVPVIIVMLLPGALVTAGEGWLFRRGFFFLLSVQGVASNLSSTAVALLLGGGVGATIGGGLIFGSLFGSGVGILVVGLGLRGSGGWAFLRADIRDVRKVLFEYKEFPLFAMPTQFIATFARQLPTLMLAAFAGTATIGYYNIANRLLGLPNTLFAQSIGSVFLQRAAKQYAETGECRTLYRKMFWGLLLTTTPVVLILAFVAPSLFAWLLGERWRVAGEYSQILCWLFAVQLVCMPLSSMMTIARRQAENLWLQIGSGFATVGMMYGAYAMFGTVKAMLVGFTIAATATQLYYGIRGFWLSAAKNR